MAAGHDTVDRVRETDADPSPTLSARADHAPRVAALDGRVVGRLLAWYALSRGVVWVAVAGGWTLRPELALHALVRRLDGSWYLDIAQFGYAAQTATPDAIAADPAVLRGAFFPLWPMLVRVTALPGVPLEVTSTALATVLGFAVVMLSWLMVARLSDRASADRAALLVCVFPGSFVLSIAYAEALMLTLVAACLLALLDRRWLLAGVAAGLATATRPNAIALLPACLWAAARAIRQGGSWRAALAPALAPAGVVAFHLFLWGRTGRLDAWNLTQRNGWEEGVDLGVRTLGRLGELSAWADPAPGTVLLGIGAMTVLVGAWALWRWHPPAELPLYAAAVVGLAAVAQTLGPRPRFVFAALPLVWALGVWARGEWFRALSVASAGGLAVLSIMYIVGSVAKP